MTKLDIFNKALAAIGVSRFLASADSTFPDAVHCRREWDGARQSVLAAHEWGWLVNETELCSGSSCTDESGRFVYTFPRPPSLRITGVMDSDDRRVKFKFVDGSIHAETEVAKIRYIPDSDTIDDWPAAVQDAVIFELAARIAIPITKNANLMTGMKQLSMAARTSAVSHDSREARFDGDSGNRYVNARR